METAIVVTPVMTWTQAFNLMAEDQKRWTWGREAGIRLPEGDRHDTDALDPEANCWCMTGLTLKMAVPQKLRGMQWSDEYQELWQDLNGQIISVLLPFEKGGPYVNHWFRPSKQVVEWNDSASTTYADILDVLYKLAQIEQSLSMYHYTPVCAHCGLCYALAPVTLCADCCIKFGWHQLSVDRQVERAKAGHHAIGPLIPGGPHIHEKESK